MCGVGDPVNWAKKFDLRRKKSLTLDLLNGLAAWASFSTKRMKSEKW
jgi:hypothetical protein